MPMPLPADIAVRDLWRDAQLPPSSLAHLTLAGCDPVLFSHTPAGYARPSMPPGTHALAWPAG